MIGIIKEEVWKDRSPVYTRSARSTASMYLHPTGSAHARPNTVWGH